MRINPEDKPRRSGFIHNTFILVGGNALAQAIGLCLMPIIARLYSPDAFGVLYILAAIAGILVPVACLRYDMAIQLPKDEKDADAIALICLLLLSMICIVLFSAILLFGDLISVKLNLGKQVKLLYFLPLLILLGGLGQVLKPMHLRARRFRLLATSNIAMAGGDRATGLSLGFAAVAGAAELVMAKAAGLILQVGIMILPRGAGFHNVFSRDSFNQMPSVAVRYSKFPKYLWSALLSRLSLQIPILVFGAFFSPVIAGYFAFSKRILNEPMNVVGLGLARSYFQRASELRRAGRDLSEISERLFYVLTAATSLPLLAIGAAGTEIFSLVFGAMWQEAGFYTLLLSPKYITTFIFRPISSLFDVMEKQKAAFIFNLIFLIISVLSLVPGGALHNPLLTVGLFSISTSLLVVSRMVWLLSEIGIPAKRSIAILLRSMNRALIFASPLLILKLFAYPGRVQIVCCAILLCIFYFLYLIAADENVRREILRMEQSSLAVAKLTARLRRTRVIPSLFRL